MLHAIQRPHVIERKGQIPAEFDVTVRFGDSIVLREPIPDKRPINVNTAAGIAVPADFVGFEGIGRFQVPTEPLWQHMLIRELGIFFLPMAVKTAAHAQVSHTSKPDSMGGYQRLIEQYVEHVKLCPPKIGKRFKKTKTHKN